MVDLTEQAARVWTPLLPRLEAMRRRVRPGQRREPLPPPLLRGMVLEVLPAALASWLPQQRVPALRLRV